MPNEKRKNTRGKKSKSRKQKSRLTYRLSDQFKEDFANLSDNHARNVSSTLITFDEHGDFTPGMKREKLPGHKDIWYLRAGGDTRITFKYLPRNVLFLRRCGSHSMLKKP